MRCHVALCLSVCPSVCLSVTEHGGVTQALDVLRKELAAERASGLELLAQVKAMLAGNSKQLAQVASTCVCNVIQTHFACTVCNERPFSGCLANHLY